MKLKFSTTMRLVLVIALITTVVVLSSRLRADTGTCGGQMITLPFTDVPSNNVFFCSIAQAFFTQLTFGTTPTTYGPTDPVARAQMAAFITRTQDSALRRGSLRAGAGQWASPLDVSLLRASTVADGPVFNCYDGEDIWVASAGAGQVTRIHASDGRALGSWTSASKAWNTISAAGFIYVSAFLNPGKIYRIDPSQSPGAVTEIENTLGAFPRGITFDGINLWTANNGTGPGTGSISRYNIASDTATNFSTGFNQPAGIVFDGTHLWVVDNGAAKLYRVNPSDGSILETISLGSVSSDVAPIFDGSNIWVPASPGLIVVSTSTPAVVLATLVGNGLGLGNQAAAFDGERILVTNRSGSGNSVSLWKATSLTPLGSLDLGTANPPFGVCSDGLHFWIVVNASTTDSVLRF